MGNDDVTSGSDALRCANPAIGEAARTMSRASAKKIRGTPAARIRAAKAGKHSWDSRRKAVFMAGWQCRDKGMDAELAWKEWTKSQDRLKKLLDQAGNGNGGLVLVKNEEEEGEEEPDEPPLSWDAGPHPWATISARSGSG